jgi:HK97 gp10 family phage protein
VSGSVEGLNETLKAFTRLGAAGKKEGAKAVAATAQKVRTDAIKSVQRGTKSGLVYTRGPGQNLSPTHQSSAPGQAPATDTGNLVSSIKAESSDLNGRVYSDIKYAFWLEFGTLKMRPRPYLNPALMSNQQYFVNQLKQAIDRATREFNRS